jgi:hypothetical protein
MNGRTNLEAQMTIAALIITMVTIVLGISALGVIVIGAYQIHSTSSLRRAELAAGRPEDPALERIQELEEEVRLLTERVDFTEKLLGPRSGDEQG